MQVLRAAQLHTFAKCRICGSHSRYYEEYCLMGSNAVYSVERQPTFRKNLSHPSSGWQKPRNIPAWKHVERQYFLPKRRLTFNGLQCVISQKITLFTTKSEERRTSFLTVERIVTFLYMYIRVPQLMWIQSLFWKCLLNKSLSEINGITDIK
jgi:hypothetical protein